MKKFVTLAMAVLLVAALVTAVLSFTVFSADAVTDITSAAELKSMKSDGNYRLTADIVLSDGTTLPSFSGKLDGNGKKITGLTAPLFASLSGSVSDLTLEGEITTTSADNVGALVNTVSADVTIDNVINNVSVTAKNATGVGGIVGYVKASTAITVTITNCRNDGDITGKLNVGGIVGGVENTGSVYSTVAIDTCVNNGTISMLSNNTGNVGAAGIIGFGGKYSNLDIDRCINNGDVSSTGGDHGIGGIYGGTTWSSGHAQKVTVSYCVNHGDITITANRGRAAGILARFNRYGASAVIEYCYNTGAISSTTSSNDGASGVFGYSNSPAAVTVKGCYNIGKVSAGTGDCYAIGGNGAGSLASDNFYIPVTPDKGTLAAHKNMQATKVNTKDELNAALLSLDNSPYIVLPDWNDGYAILASECTHESINDTCTGKICEICDQVVEVKDGKHSFDEWVIDEEASDFEDGLCHRECNKCHVVEKKIISSTITVTPVDGVYSVMNVPQLVWVFTNIENGTVDASATIQLAADIDLGGKLSMLEKTFTGVLDGNGKTISGISNALFLQFNGTAMDLTLRGEIDATKISDQEIARRTASLALNAQGGVFKNIISYVNLKVKSGNLNIGGLVGYAKVTNVFTNCQYAGNMTVEWTGSDAGIGGIVGWCNASGGTVTLDGCHFSGKISVTGGVSNKDCYVGGMLGNCSNPQLVIRNCTSDGTILSEVALGNDYVGGILGINKNSSTTVEFCANKSDVTAHANGGGIVGGVIVDTTVTSCTNFGTVDANTKKGALCGTADTKTITFNSCVNFIGSLGLCGTNSVSGGSYTADKVVDLNRDFTIDGVEYKRYNVCLIEKENGRMVPILSTDEMFKPYISLRDDGETQAVRFVVLTNQHLCPTDSVTVSITFKDILGKTVKTFDQTLAATGGDFTLYSAVSAGGVNYFAANDNALFGCVVVGIPVGAWNSIELTIEDTANGTVYLAPASFTMDFKHITFDEVPDFSSLGTASPLYNSGPGLMSDKDGTTEEDNYVTVIGNTTAEKLAAYVKTLPEYGFAEISRNTLDGDTYYTYKKYGSLLYLYYNAKLKETRIILDNASDPLSKISYDYTKKTGDTTAFYQYSINYTGNNELRYDPVTYTESGAINCGMCYIFKLPDNKLVVIDSGHEKQSTEQSRAGLMQFMREITGTPEGEKVEIAMWFITHAHGDHVRLASDFISEYHDMIDLESVTYNFPSYQVLKSGYDGNTFTLKESINTYFPDVTYHKLHTGEQISLAGVLFDVVYTHENAVNQNGSTMIGDFNSSSTVLKITMDGKTIMILGDISGVAETAIVNMHSEAYLKSDIVQSAHHCFNSLNTLYPIIGAKIAVFPQSMYNAVSGNKSKYDSIMKYADEAYFAHKYTYKFTVENGEIEVEALPRYDQK